MSKHRLADLLRDVDRQLATDNPGLVVIRRLDAGYDSGANRRWLAGLPGYFLMKSAESDSAAALAATIPLNAWLPVAEGVPGSELPVYDGIRRRLYQFYLTDGRRAYSMLVTNLPAAHLGVIRRFEFYNGRQTIEAFFCQSRQVFQIQTLRSRHFKAIAAFLHFVFLTHNLLVWVKQTRFAQTDLATATMRHLVRQAAQVRAQITWDGQWPLFILNTGPWARRLLDTLQPHLVQLDLPFARLHKT